MDKNWGLKIVQNFTSTHKLSSVEVTSVIKVLVKVRFLYGDITCSLRVADPVPLAASNR